MKALVVGLVVCAVLAYAESRFGRAVVRPFNDKDLAHVRLDGNNIPVKTKGVVAVSCVVYRGTQRYYVEIGVVNQSDAPIKLREGFTQFLKPGYTVFQSDTTATSQAVAANVAGRYVPPPPPPPSTTTTYSATATTYGNTTQIHGTATTAADGWSQLGYALGQAIAAARYRRLQAREQSFAAYMQTFANERQSLEIAPKAAQLYVFTFERVSRKKGAFMIAIQAGGEYFAFDYAE